MIGGCRGRIIFKYPPCIKFNMDKGRRCIKSFRSGLISISGDEYDEQMLKFFEEFVKKELKKDFSQIARDIDKHIKKEYNYSIKFLRLCSLYAKKISAKKEIVKFMDDYEINRLKEEIDL